MHTIEYCSVVKKNETMKFSSKWMEVRQLRPQKTNTICSLSYSDLTSNLLFYIFKMEHKSAKYNRDI